MHILISHQHNIHNAYEPVTARDIYHHKTGPYLTKIHLTNPVRRTIIT